MADSASRTTIASLAQSVAAAGGSSIEGASESGSAYADKDVTVSAHAHQFRKVLELSDVVLQVLDARDPMGTRSRVVEDQILKSQGDKKLVLVLNKIDLVPKDNVQAWLRYLRHDHPAIPLKSSPTGRPSTSANAGPPHLLTLLKSFRRPHTSLTIGVVGAPNVGKSSLINALRRIRTGAGGDAPCTVGAKPGETRVIKEVGLERGLKILDSPGIVWGGFMGGSEGEVGGVSTGSLNMLDLDGLDDPTAIVETIIPRIPAETLQRVYSIPPFANPTEMLVMIALSRGRLGKGGTPDISAAARSVLHDWNVGNIPYHTIPPAVHPSSIPSLPSIPASVQTGESSMQMRAADDVGQAQILNKFDQAFDLEGLWQTVDEDVLGDGDREMDETVDETQDRIDVDEETAAPLDTPTAPSRPSIAPKRNRYDPLAPVVIPAHELSQMSGANPLGRKKLREEAKRKRRAEGKEMQWHID
ncbi:hypothetical protein BOTBODRAFT_43022 [Botryobasidium botryosum FD-172 SS1]|uniref:CP-type G domain-containing protein n=1 Tax=Botryobasidium botryosum (strain FD-172 SS1) TaxID=930990 RepID=A0A067N0V5_BOTB1|nr:hypothetical protein BOTBODRAFT_43022 [Botryobasidium botryosum FD-172 SS1]